MKLETVCGNIKEREIILYGDSSEIGDFLQLYQKILKIKMVITDHKKEVKLQAYADLGIKTVLIEDVVFKDELIIICDRNHFGILLRRLKHLDKTEYKDFISKELVDAMVRQKELMVCMGTQLMEQVNRILKQGSDICDKYSMLYYAESDIFERYINRWQEYVHVCRWCNVYIRSSCNKEKFSSKILDKSVLNSECRIITVSDYGFCGYFPQLVGDRDLFSDFLLRERERIDIDYETLIFSRIDREIEARCRKKECAADICNEILDDNFYSVSEVKKYFERELDSLKILEKDDDVKLSAFIEANRQSYLCRNLNEWNEPVISYVANELLEKLGLPKLSSDTENRQKLIEDNSGCEILVYPSVQKALGMKEKRSYKVTTYYHVRYMTAGEYIRFITEYLYKAMEVMQIMGVDKEIQDRIELQ